MSATFAKNRGRFHPLQQVGRNFKNVVNGGKLDGKERDIALASIEIVKNEELNAEYGYHRPCYQRSVSTFIVLLSQLMHASYITFKR